MTRETLEMILWAFIFSLVATTWLINFKNNHYKRGYRDGYNRGRFVASERHFD